MKKIQKEIVRKSYADVYVADDGREFDSQSECESYERTAKCALMARYNLLVLKESDSFELFGFGSDEDIVDVVKMKSEEDMNLILQIIILENPWNYDSEKADTPDEEQKRKANLNKVTVRMNRALQEGDLIFIGKGFDADGFWFSGTRNEHIDVLRNLDKLTEKSEDDSE